VSNQGLHQSQKQAQSLVLAPQLRQSLKILQVSALELNNTILEELQTNPTLEESSMEVDSVDDIQASGSDEDNEFDDSELDFKEDFEILNKIDQDWKEYFAEESGSQQFSKEDEDSRKHFFDSIESETSIQEHLMQQAELAECTEKELIAIEYLIGSLDNRGYLKNKISEIALMAKLPLEDVQRAHTTLKSFDPLGIGSSDLQECLLTQMDMGPKGENQLAREIVKNDLQLLLRRRIPELSRKRGCTVADIQSAIEYISSLDPTPGRQFMEDTNRTVSPDVKVEKNGEDWNVIVNNDYIPRLRISSTYKTLLAKKTLSKEEKEYLRNQIRSGKSLISSIEQRQQTIERITNELLDLQKKFFEEGVSSLKPLIMNVLAERLGVHETTISRAIANKYIDTPHGIFEFKFFFTFGFSKEGGEKVSNTSIKEIIVDFVEKENPSKPISDSTIVKMLADKDIKLARRTVAKYREELGILPTHLRREYS
jgi:RNA polymerase sigma-54 factor